MFLRCTTRNKNGKEHRYWNLVENRRVAGGQVVQRQVLYLGEINDSQREVWRKSIEVFEDGRSAPRTVALFAEEQTAPIDDEQVIQVRLKDLEVRNARQWGGCWLVCELYEQLKLDQFWAERLPPGRKGTRWDLILQTLCIYRFIEPGSEWRLHRYWFDRSAVPELLGSDFRLAESHRLYECHDLLLKHKGALFTHLTERWKDLFNAKFEILLYDLTSTYFECDPPIAEADKRTIGPVGGTITVANSGTPLDGAKVTFPVGALSANAQVNVSFNQGTLTPVSGVFPGAALVLDVQGTHLFSQPVSITVPYSGGSSSVPVPYYANATGAIRPAQIISIDRQGGTFTFQTFHASIFTWILGPLFPNQSVATNYLPSNDGFKIVNSGANFSRNGECFGMTSFSLWFWINEKSALGNFYPNYMGPLGTDSNGDPILGQNVIATRAFTSIDQKWTAYYPGITAQTILLSPQDRYALIDNILANTSAPVLIYLCQSAGLNAHSVLAYSVDNTTGKISIYDPNFPFPGTIRTIQYSPGLQSFQPYSSGQPSYDEIFYCGDGSLNLTEPYTNIWPTRKIISTTVPERPLT